MPIKLNRLVLNPYAPPRRVRHRGVAQFVRAMRGLVKRRTSDRLHRDNYLRNYSTRTMHHRLGPGVQFEHRPRYPGRIVLAVRGARLGWYCVDPMGDGDGRDRRRMLREARAAWINRQQG